MLKGSLGAIHQSATLICDNRGRGITAALEQLLGFVLLLSVEICL